MRRRKEWQKRGKVEDDELFYKKAAPPKNCRPPPLDMPQLPAACWAAARHSTYHVHMGYCISDMFTVRTSHILFNSIHLSPFLFFTLQHIHDLLQWRKRYRNQYIKIPLTQCGTVDVPLRWILATRWVLLCRFWPLVEPGQPDVSANHIAPLCWACYFSPVSVCVFFTGTIPYLSVPVWGS